jgi:ParB-like chromosome segregation protein Spo0J
MTNQVQLIAIDKLIAHPDNPNRMSKMNFAKLVRNIEQTGRYEPLVVRPAPKSPGTGTFFLPNGQPVEAIADFDAGFFQIINGHHRWQALKKLGRKTCDAIVWDIDDEQADILLATLNRLGGSDVLERKLALLKRLNIRMQAERLAKLLPQTAKQIERLTSLASGHSSLVARAPSNGKRAAVFANPLVFFMNDRQQEIIENALSLARSRCVGKNEKTKAAKNAAALTYIAQHFLMQESRHQSGA